MNTKALLDSFRENNSDHEIVQNVRSAKKALESLKDAVSSLNDDELNFLQSSYIELFGGLEILNLSLNFPNSGYFFSGQFFEKNLQSFYSNFAIKDRLATLKDEFKDNQTATVKEALKGDSIYLAGLYIFIENIARKFGDEDKQARAEFKKKLIKFYSSLYKVFEIFSKDLLSKYFNLTLYNHPMAFMLLLKSQNSNLKSLVENFSENSHLNLGLDDDQEMIVLGPDLLTELISIILLLDESATIIYSKESLKILSSIYKTEIKNLDDFINLALKFSKEYISYPDELTLKSEQNICHQLFFNHILKYSGSNLSKNTLFLGSVGVNKNKMAKEILEIKNIPNDRYKIISITPDTKYEDLIDGFKGGKFYNGEFKKICQKAVNDTSNDYYIILNDINYCDTRVFNEILELATERYSSENQRLLRTKNSSMIDSFSEVSEYSVVVENGASYFAIPENLYIIATFDICYGYAYPRLFYKFDTIRLKCDYSMIKSELNGTKNADAFIKMSQKANELLMDMTNDIELGHYIFLRIKRYIKNSEITQAGLTLFYKEELKPILCSLLKESVPKELSSFKAIFNL